MSPSASAMATMSPEAAACFRNSVTSSLRRSMRNRASSRSICPAALFDRAGRRKCETRPPKTWRLRGPGWIQRWRFAGALRRVAPVAPLPPHEGGPDLLRRSGRHQVRRHSHIFTRPAVIDRRVGCESASLARGQRDGTRRRRGRAAQSARGARFIARRNEGLANHPWTTGLSVSTVLTFRATRLHPSGGRAHSWT